MFRTGIATGLMLLLAACGGGERSQPVESEAAENPFSVQHMWNEGSAGRAATSEVAVIDSPMSPPAPAPKMAADQDERFRQQDGQPGGGGGGQPGQPASDAAAARLIAYTYFYGFQVPTVQMEGLLNAQKTACEAAGPAKCYVVSSTINGLGEEHASATLEMKAAADWVTSFKSNLNESLKPFGAEVDATNTTSEDLTVQIVDTTARLNSNKTLRDRLQALLQDRPGKLSDLLEIERELARVQGEIDSTESILAAMKLRVSMSALTLTYQPKYSAVSESIWRPLGDAFSDFVPSIVRSLAFIVELFSGLILWIILIVGVVWFLLARMGGRRPKPRPKTVVPPPIQTPNPPTG